MTLADADESISSLKSTESSWTNVPLTQPVAILEVPSAASAHFILMTVRSVFFLDVVFAFVPIWNIVNMFSWLFLSPSST